MHSGAFARPSARIGYGGSNGSRKENQPPGFQTQTQKMFGYEHINSNGTFAGTSYKASKQTTPAAGARSTEYLDDEESASEFTSEFPPPSSPPLRYTGNPLFNRRSITTSHTKAASWDSELLPPPPDSDISDASDFSSALPTYRRSNFRRDPELIRRAAASTEATGLPSTSYYDETNNTTLKPNFNEDDLDANTPRLERQLVKAATRDLGANSSRLDIARHSQYRGVVGSVASESESGEGSDSRRREWKSQRLLETLSRGKAVQRPVSAAEAPTIAFGDDDASSSSLVSIRRSLSDSSGDARRRKTPADIAAQYSPSRRRRLQEALAKKPEVAPGLPLRYSWQGQMPAVPEGVDFSPEPAQQPQQQQHLSPEPTITTTIDWLAAAAPTAPEVHQRIFGSTNNAKGKAVRSSKFSQIQDDDEYVIRSASAAQARIPASTSSLRQNSTIPRASKTYAGGISAIAEVSEPPTSSPYQYKPPLSAQKPKSVPIGRTDADMTIRKLKGESENPDETRDILRRLSRAASSSPSSSPRLSTVTPHRTSQSRTISSAATRGDESVLDTSFLLPDLLATEKEERSMARTASKPVETIPNVLKGSSRPFTRSDAPSRDAFASFQASKQAKPEAMPPMKPKTVDAAIENNVHKTTTLRRTPNMASIAAPKPFTLNRLTVSSDDIQSSFLKEEEQLSSPTSERVSRIRESSMRKSPQNTPGPKNKSAALTQKPLPPPLSVELHEEPSLVYDPDEDYHTDDSLDRLMAHDTDYSSLLRPSRFEEDSFLEAVSAGMEPSQVDIRAREKELARQAKMNNRLLELQLQIRTARKGIEQIERKIEGGVDLDLDDSSFVDSSMLQLQGYTPRRRMRRKTQKKSEIPFYQRKLRVRDWICLIFLLIAFLLILEIRAWSNSFMPQYGTLSADEWYELHPPGSHQWGVTMRFFVSFAMLVYTAISWVFHMVARGITLAMAGVQYCRTVAAQAAAFVEETAVELGKRIVPETIVNGTMAEAVGNVLPDTVTEGLLETVEEYHIPPLGGEEYIPPLGREEWEYNEYQDYLM